MKQLIEEFKAFAFKGNIIELAVAVILGAAFKPIIDALVGGVLMPIIGAIFGERSFDKMYFKVGDGVVMYGTVITAIVSFILTAMALFAVIKAYKKSQKPAEAAAPAGPSKEEQLLTEIRDALKK